MRFHLVLPCNCNRIPTLQCTEGEGGAAAPATDGASPPMAEKTAIMPSSGVEGSDSAAIVVDEKGPAAACSAGMADATAVEVTEESDAVTRSGGKGKSGEAAEHAPGTEDVTPAVGGGKERQGGGAEAGATAATGDSGAVTDSEDLTPAAGGSREGQGGGDEVKATNRGYLVGMLKGQQVLYVWAQ